jgi:TonB family protein
MSTCARSTFCWGLALCFGCGASSATSPQEPIEVVLERPSEIPPPEPKPVVAATPQPPREVRPLNQPEFAPEGDFVESGVSGGVVMGVAGGTVSGTGTAPWSAPPTLGTRPRPRNKLACAFPENRKDGVSEGHVTLRLTVDASGALSDVKIASDSGGFAQEAIRCVKAAQFLPGTDDAGNAITATAVIRVRYEQN